MWLALLLLASSCAVDTTDDGRQDDVLAAVAAYADPLGLRWDPTAVRIAWADVSGDGLDDPVVTLAGQDWCGSGGCTLLVFETMDAADAEEMGPYRPAAEISQVHGPVHVVRRGERWCDLVVEADGSARVLHFDGETYPPSPFDGPLLRGPLPPGTTLFADAP